MSIYGVNLAILCYPLKKEEIIMATKDKVRINVNVDRDLKEAAAQIYEDMGLNINTAVKMFLKQTVNDNGLPFKPNAKKSELNAKNQKELDEAINQLKNGKGIEFDNVADFKKWLHEV